MTTEVTTLLGEMAEKGRLEQEMFAAREIQQKLLPAGPLRVTGLAVTAFCEPAREVGGDYYDFLPITDSMLGLLIADVAGKYYVPKLGAFIVYTLMIVILLWRPQGLFARAAAR